MLAVSTTVKRLAMALLGACLLMLGTPLLGVAPANAVSPSGPSVISFWGDRGATGSRQVFSTIDSNAQYVVLNATIPGSGYDPIASIALTIVDTTAQVSQAGATLTTPPWRFPIYPSQRPAGNNLSLNFTAYDVNNIAMQTIAMGAVFSAYPDKLAITSPSGNAMTIDSSGNIGLSGTYTGPNYVNSVRYYVRDAQSGVIGASGYMPLAKSGGTWSATMAAPACPNASPVGCDLLAEAITQPFSSSGTPSTYGWTGDQAHWRMRSYGMPTSGAPFLTLTATKSTVGLGTPQALVATVSDAYGIVLSGQTIQFTKTSNNSQLTTTSGVSNFEGIVQTGISDASAETTTVTATNVSTAGAPTPSVTFTTLGPSAATLTPTPVKALAATLFTGSQAGTGSVAPLGSEYTSTTPAVRLCFAASNGSPLNSASSGVTANVVASLTRTVKNGTTSTPGSPSTPTLTSDQSANPGCYLVVHPAGGSEEEGQDTFSGYYNANGQAGYQPSSSDVQATPVTTSWGQLKLTGSSSIAVKGANATMVLTAKTPVGQAFAGRKLNLAITSPSTSTLTGTQPVGTTALSATTATCLIDSTGACQVSVTDTNSVTTVLTASDNITDATLGQSATGTYGTAQVTFNATPGGLDAFTTTPVTLLQPAVNTAGSRLRPGDIAHYAFTMIDTNSSPLASKTVTLNLTNGYFTPDCTNYTSCTFSPGPGDGNTVSAPASIGKTMSITSDSSGVIRFATAIGRDTRLDVKGTLDSAVTAIGSGGAANARLETFSTLGTALANAGTLALVPLSSSDALTGKVASNGTNKIPGQSGVLATPGSNFQVRVTDSFGNLATLSSCLVNLSVTPTGTQTTGAGAYLGSPGNTTASGCGSYTNTATVNGVPVESFHLDTDNPSSTPNGLTLSSNWAVPSTIFRAVAGSQPLTYTTVAGTAPALTTTNTLSLYAVDQRALSTALSSTTGSSSAPITSAQVNSTVTTSAQIADNQGNPVAGLTVTFTRTGPNTTAGTPQSASSTGTTSSTGTASTTLTSATPGVASLLAVTTNSSGTELTRGTTTITFTTSPTPSATPTPTASGSPTATPSALPTPAPTTSGSPIASPTPSNTPSPMPTATGTPTASPSSSATPVPTSPAGSVVTISGGDWQSPVFNTTFALTGTAPAGALVTLRFRKAGMAAGDYSLTRNIITPANGVWVRPIAAIFDYRFYATITTTTGLVSSGNVLFQPTALINGPLNVTTAKNKPYTITGKAAPYSLVYLHFHKAGTPAADYSIVRAVRVNSVGTWSRAILASSDYRYFASRNATDTPAGRANYRFIAQ